MIELLENLCVSLETAKALVATGIVIESVFSWFTRCNESRLDYTDWLNVDKWQQYPASTSEELWTLIPYTLNSPNLEYNDRGHLKFYIESRETYYQDVNKKLLDANVVAWNTYLARITDNYKVNESFNLKLCEALAQMLLWLKKEGYLG